MLYTSGTTHRPKGVLSTQRAALWSVAACYAPIFGLSSGDRPALTPLSALRLVGTLIEAGLPEEVVTIVIGNADIGAAIVAAPVRVVSCPSPADSPLARPSPARPA
jgi:non-ribosomal peptide synthetase component F